jgi:hypothetical protein
MFIKVGHTGLRHNRDPDSSRSCNYKSHLRDIAQSIFHFLKTTKLTFWVPQKMKNPPAYGGWIL